MEKELVFIKENGMKIRGKAYIPDKGEGKYPTIIFSHGFNAFYKMFEHHAKDFNDAGMNFILFDFIGGSENTSSDGTLEDMTVLTEVDDLKFVISKVSEFDYVDENSLILMGESMGGFVSSYVAAKMPDRFKSIVLWYPAFVIPDDSRKRFKENDNTCFGLKISPNFNKDSKDIDIFDVIKDYKGPVQIIHGDKDPVVPYSYSVKADEVYDNSSLLIIPGASHGFNEEESKIAKDASIALIKANL